MSGLVDTSVFFGAWPFRRLDHSAPAELKAHLSACRVAEAWVAPFEGIFYQDPMTANEALFEKIRGDRFFVQTGVLDLSLPAWRRDAEACLNNLGCGAFKLFPNYHRYALNLPSAAELAELAAKAGVPVCVQLRMQDERGHHPLVKVPGVEVKDLIELAQRCPRTRFLACAGYLRDLKEMRETKNIWAEPSFVESENTLKSAVHAFGSERLVFASHSPLYYFEAAAAKLDVAAEDVSAEVVAAVGSGNVRSLRGMAR
ncbi:MAG: amidohydrolase family protein [Planctomycetes bacterium]|nr:amidohydrolase family protein [Planctomycetota bacterium]